jgi:hypothetical protein
VRQITESFRSTAQTADTVREGKVVLHLDLLIERCLIVAGVLFLASGSIPAQGSKLTAPNHPIGVRMVKNNAELYDRSTNKRFMVRGTNYIRLADLKKFEGNMLLYHSTFNTGRYEATRMLRDMQKMVKSGYNVVRVFLNAATEGGIRSKGDSLSDDYIKNLSDFLIKAKENKLYVILTLDWIPVPVPLSPPPSAWCSDYQCSSVHILTEDGIRANQNFFTRLVRNLLAHKAPTDMILAYELRNELTFDSELPPLSLTSGSVTTANGKTYDLSSAVEKNRMLEEGLVYWIDRVRGSILQVDPTALISVGFIPPGGPNPARVGEKKISVVGQVIRKSLLDVVDIHVYPDAGGPTLSQLAENFGIVGFNAKPVIMGEFGALTEQYPSREAALRKMVDLQAASCALGIDGWIFWAWQIEKNPDTYNLMDDNEIMNLILAPVNRPDPCSGTIVARVRKNRTDGAKVSASKTFEKDGPEFAVDETTRPWRSGGDAPQWIELDLLKPDSVQMIRLVVSQYPAGETVHQIWVRGENEEYRLVKELRGRTKDRDVIEIPTPGLAKIRFVRILTVQSPSWVGWREVEVIRPTAR